MHTCIYIGAIQDLDLIPPHFHNWTKYLIM